MKFPKELKYSKDHEWLRVEGNNAYIGITEFAQGELGDIVFIEFPDVNSIISIYISNIFVYNQSLYICNCRRW